MNYTVQQSAFSHFFTSNTASAPLWLIVRLYLGYEWLMAGWTKVMNPAWVGSDAGAAMQSFVQRAIAKAACAPEAAVCYPDVQLWYAAFLESAVLPNLTAWSYAIAFGELLVGLGLIVGLFTGLAAFFGFFMNVNFMLAGAISLNPIWMLLALGLMLAHRVAGHYGLDRYARRLYPRFGRASSPA